MGDGATVDISGSGGVGVAVGTRVTGLQESIRSPSKKMAWITYGDLFMIDSFFSKAGRGID
jgi:hypothetical protein